MDEKRKFSRVSFAINTLFTYQGQSYQGEVGDLSLKGMFVKTPAPVNVTDRIQFKIQLTGDTSELIVNLNGVVIRKTSDGLGIRFDQIDLDSFVHLRNIVTYNSQDIERVEEEFLDYVKENIKSNS